MEEAADVAARNELESVFELEALLVQIFKDADKDDNGYLDPAEFAALLDTADLGLGDMEKKQLLMIADANGDGKMEYAEFAPLGADVIQTMRMRKLNQEENEFLGLQDKRLEYVCEEIRQKAKTTSEVKHQDDIYAATLILEQPLS